MLAGTLRPDRDRRQPARVPTDVTLEPPPVLSRDAEAARMFRHLAGRLAAQRLLSPNDVEALAIACAHWSIAWRALQDVRRFGTVVDTRRGRVKNPALTVWRDSAHEFVRLCSRFGLTPVDRDRVAPVAIDDELDELLEGG